MLRLLTLLSLLFGLTATSLTPVYARDKINDTEEEANEEETSTKKDKKKKKKAPKKVSDALKELEFITETEPNTKAKYYIYLCSASWCGPCNKEMPDVVKAYEEMRKQGKTELILISADKTKDAAKAFLEKYKAEFPAVMGSDVSEDNLPGYKEVSGIPTAIFVNAKGEELTSGHGSMIAHWEDAIKHKKAKKKNKDKKNENFYD